MFYDVTVRPGETPRWKSPRWKSPRWKSPSWLPGDKNKGGCFVMRWSANLLHQPSHCLDDGMTSSLTGFDLIAVLQGRKVNCRSVSRTVGQEMDTFMVQTCCTPRQPLQNHPSGHLGHWLAEEMLDGQRQRVDIPAYAKTAHKGLLQKRQEDFC